MIKTCQYANCLEDLAEDAVFVSLKTPTNSYEKRAGFCCAYHAAFSLLCLAVNRKENPYKGGRNLILPPDFK